LTDSPPRPRRRRLRRIAKWFLISLVLVQGCFWWSVRLPVPDVDVPVPPTPTVNGERASLPDGSYVERRDGYWFFLHRGDAVTLGAQHAVLGEFLIQRVEDAMFSDFQDRMPAALRFVLVPTLMWHYRHMADNIPPEQLEELWGFSDTYADRHSFPLSAYRRGIFYHALHDITQELVGYPMIDPSVAGACTAFAASGPATVDGHLLIGRNFDFEVFPLFDSEKVVHLYAREEAIPVLSVSWMAMAGVVTGMNAEGIWISINAASSEGKNRKGPPVSLWVRSILEEATSLDDVERLLTEKAPMVTDIYFVGDGKTGEAAVFERGQTRIARRDMSDEGRLVASNHLLTETFAGDLEDADLRSRSSTLSRGMRMDELVAAEPLSAERALAILRDRKGPGGVDLPPGNRNAIDALIATHSAFADLTDRVMWVSTAPHTQGEYRAIDMLAELDAAGISTSGYRAGLPAGARAWEVSEGEDEDEDEGEIDHEVEVEVEVDHDHEGEGDSDIGPVGPRDFGRGDLIESDGWDLLVRHRAFLEDGDAYLDDERWGRARDMAVRAEELIPETTDAAWLRGEACAGLGDDACARDAFTQYLQRFPSRGPDHGRATGWLQEHGGVPEVERPDDP